MFYEDDEGVQVLEMGKGDVVIAAGMLPDCKTGSLSFVENCGCTRPIGMNHADQWGEMTPDTNLNTVIRFTFIDPRSLDVLISECQKAKQYMQDPKSHPWYEKMANKRVEPTLK